MPGWFWFWRRRWKSQKFTDRRTHGQTDDRRSEKFKWAALKTIVYKENVINRKSNGFDVECWVSTSETRFLIISRVWSMKNTTVQNIIGICAQFQKLRPPSSFLVHNNYNIYGLTVTWLHVYVCLFFVLFKYSLIWRRYLCSGIGVRHLLWHGPSDFEVISEDPIYSLLFPSVNGTVTYCFNWLMV